MAAPKTYECHNKSCSLGTVNPWTPGRFREGMSEETRALLGLPEDSPTGEGVCPNCGVEGKAI